MLHRCYIPFLLVLLSTSLWLLAMEVGGRVYFLGWRSLSPTLLRSIPYIGDVIIVQPSEISGLRLSGELRPNLDTYSQMVPFKTNSHGLRDKEYTVKKPPSTFRVAMIGDSFTVPEGVRIDDAYHSLLEEWFNESSRSLTYEFLNFGVGGYQLPEYAATLKGKALSYTPDLIFIAFCPRNDFRPYDPTPPESESTAAQPLRKARWSYLAHRYDLLRAQLLGEQIPLRDGAHLWTIQQAWQPSHEQFEENKDFMRKALQTIGNIAREHGIPILLANIDYSPINEELRTFLENVAEENAMMFIDISQNFPKGKEPMYRNSRSDNHPNASANKIFATHLYNFLRETRLVPL